MKRKKIAIIGALVAVVSMVILLLPLNSLFAGNPPTGELAIGEYSCVENDGEEVSVEITMSGDNGAPGFGGFPPGYKWRLDVDGSEVWRTPYGLWQVTSPVGYVANLGLGSHTVTFYISNFYLGPWPHDIWAWVEVDSETFEVVLCEEPEPEVGNITVVKRDPGGNLLAGAGFTVYLQASGNPALPEGFTDGSGMITFAGLPLDTYIVRETTAPAGFGLAPDQVAVLNVDNLAVTVNFVDDPVTTGGGETATVTPPPAAVEVLGIAEELPFTGQSMWLYIIGAAMLALAGGLTFVLRAAKSKE